jgi:hypothetical protein
MKHRCEAIFKSIERLNKTMYENVKYKITKIVDHPGPRFECHIFWIEENKYEKFFLNDDCLGEDALINRIDDLYEQFHNKGSPVEQAEKKAKIEDLKKKLVKL